MDTDKIAEIIQSHYWEMYPILNPPVAQMVTDKLIDALAGYFEAEAQNQCDAMGCDEEGHRGGLADHTQWFDRAEFLRIAKAE